MSDIAIKVENLSKYYRLGQINNGTLYKDLQSWFAKKLNKEDPNGIIGKTFSDEKDGFWALKDLNFEIKQGDKVGIIGRNGAGKSTLLKVISEITAPTKGDVYINGRIASLLEVGTGFHLELTGRENIYMNGAILGMKKSEITRKLDEIIDFAEIEKYIDTPVKRYSSGMYVRLAFAVAAHLNSEILIADEVLAVGDAAFQKKALGKMNDLSTGQGRTVLFVSHNMAQVKSLCSKGLILEKGSMIFHGAIEKAISVYSVGCKQIRHEDISLIRDLKVKRGAGSVHFKQAFFDKEKYSIGEDIRFVLSVFSDQVCKGLHVSICFKSEMNEFVTSVSHSFSDDDVEKNKIYNAVFNLKTDNLRKGIYQVYLWVGDNAALNGVITNVEVLDGLIAPLIIEDPDNKKKNGFFDIDYTVEAINE